MNSKLKQISVAVLLSATLTLPGCGSKQQGPPPPCNCTISPTFLYTATINSLSSFNLAANGVPSLISSQAGPNQTPSIVADPSGRFLYVSDFVKGAVDAYAISSSNGTLTPVSGSPFSAGPAPGAGGIAIDPQTRFLYITLLNSSAVEGYTIDAASGALTPIPGSPFPAGNTPMHAIVDPGGKFLYVSNYNDAMGTISAFAIDSATGVLTAVAGSPFATQANFPGPSAFAFAGSGKFLYVGLAGTVNGNDLIAGFAVNTTTGALTQLGGSPFTGDFNPQQLAADATGKFLFSANLAAGTVSVFTIDNDSGALTLVNNFDAGGAADSLTLDPTNGFLFVGTQQAITGAAPNGISVFSLDTSTGNLSSIQGSPFATGQYYYGLAIAKP